MADLNSVIKLVIEYRYLILFPVAVIEGPIISIIAGFLCSGGFLNFLTAYLVLMLADLVGDSLYYAVGRYGGRRFIERWGKYIRLNADKLTATERHFNLHPKKTLFFGKTQAWGALILVAAGVAKMSYRYFLAINVAATIIKTFLFLLLGYYFGQIYSTLNTYLGYTNLILFVVGVLVVYFFLKRYQKSA